MGGSKAQTVGYKYFKGVMAVIGNRIEQLLDINPDNRGWIMTPEQKKLLKSGRTSLIIDQPNLFGGDKKEGGWVGALDIYVGEDNQPQNPYLAKQIGPDVSAYPSLSYLVFHGLDIIFTPENFEIEQRPSLIKGFQLVSMSGMMKEFMLWVKRIYVKNDGSLQWYDEKAGIGGNRFEGGGDYFRVFNINFVGTVYWSDLTQEYSQGWGSGAFPFFDSVQSYQSDPNSGDGNGEELPVKPSAIAAQETLLAHGVEFDASSGTRIPPCTWDGTAPGTDYFENGAIARQFFYDGFFYWIGGVFEYKVVISENNAGIEFLKLNEESREYESFSTISAQFGSGYSYLESSINLVKGYYKIHVSVGERYANLNTPRPFLQLLAKYKEKSKDEDGIDINPIHKIREILTDDIAMGKPESDINDENFRVMADRIYDEGLGISWCIQEKSCKEALDELGYHIEGGVRQNRQTGLYEVILFRDDLLDLDNALHFDETNIKSFQPDIINAEDQINAANVSFYDRENIKQSAFSLSDVGSFHTIDHENAEELKFPYFMNRRNAELVGNWKLKQLSTMAWKGTFTTGRYEARKLNKYDVVLLSWISKNIINLPVRVMDINLGNGRDNTVTVDFIEVVPYSSTSYSSVNIDPNPAPILSPQPNRSIVFEMPYFEAVQRMGQTSVDAELASNPEIGYLMAATTKPQNNSLHALLYTDGGQGSLDLLEEEGVVDYCASCVLDQDISFTDTAFVVKDAQDLSRVQIGTLVQIDQELLVYQGFDPVTKVLTVKRGALDTIPEPHLKDAVFYFWDDSSGLDQTVYVDGETVHAKVLTTTPSGVENLGTSVVRILEIKGRANRPYPPANVKINGEYYPDLEISEDLEVSWVNRNRIQQTGGNILGFFDAGVGVENGVTYAYELFDSDTNILVDSGENITSPLTISKSKMAVNNRLELFSIRNNFKSYQQFKYEFVKSSKEFWSPANIQNLGIWIDAEDSIVDSNNRITSIIDKSTNSFSFTGSPTNSLRVTNDTTVLSKCLTRVGTEFIESGNAGNVFGSKTKLWSFFVIKNTSSSGTGSDAFMFRTNNYSFGLVRNADNSKFKPQFYFRTQGNSWVLNGTNTDLNNDWSLCLMSYDLSNGKYQIYINGVLDSSGIGVTGVSGGNSSMYIGDYSGFFDFLTPCMLFGSEDISPDISKIFGWAAHKYGLQSNLPQDHPYKIYPPLV